MCAEAAKPMGKIVEDLPRYYKQSPSYLMEKKHSQARHSSPAAWNFYHHVIPFIASYASQTVEFKPTESIMPIYCIMPHTYN